MIVKLIFVVFVIFILKLFIIKFDYRDYFNVLISLFIVFFSYLYIINSSKIFIFIVILFSIILIIYSFLEFSGHNDDLIISRGIINFKNMYKSHYDFNSLLNELKSNHISFLDDNICALLKNNKLTFYIKKDSINFSFIPLIIDGVINTKSLLLLRKSSTWLLSVLSKKNCPLSDVRFFFFHNGTYYLIKK